MLLIDASTGYPLAVLIDNVSKDTQANAVPVASRTRIVCLAMSLRDGNPRVIRSEGR